MLTAVGDTLCPVHKFHMGLFCRGQYRPVTTVRPYITPVQKPLAHPLYLTLSSSSSASGVITCLRRQFTTKYLKRFTSSWLAQGWYNMTTAPCWNHKKIANFCFSFFSSHVKLKAKLSPWGLSITPWRQEGKRYSSVYYYYYYYYCYQMGVRGQQYIPRHLTIIQEPLIPTDYETERAPELVCVLLCRREKLLVPLLGT